jgi:hypothetical protein
LRACTLLERVGELVNREPPAHSGNDAQGKKERRDFCDVPLVLQMPNTSTAMVSSKAANTSLWLRVTCTAASLSRWNSCLRWQSSS